MADETETSNGKNERSPIISNVDRESEIPPSRSMRARKAIITIFTNITVEPAVFLFTVAMALSGITTQSLTIFKYCFINLGYPEEICRNLTYYKNYEKQAQTLATDFIMYKTLLESMPTVIWALFVGSWSDKNGRKMLLILPCVGGCLGMIMMIFNAHFLEELNVNYILVASVPYAVGGNTLAVMTASISYIADITTISQRTVRFGIIQAVYLCGLPIGVAGGGLLFQRFGYIVVYVVSACLYILSILYIVPFVRESVQVSSTQSRCWSLFQLKNVKEGFRTLCKKRERNDRLYLFLLITSAAISFLPLYAEYNVTYLYTRWKFQWDEVTYSYYSTCVFIVCMIGLFLCLPLMSYIFKMRDLTIGILSASSKVASELIIATSTQGWMLFAATPILIVSGMNSTIIRTVMSKIVSSEEQGKITAVMGAAEAAVPTLGSLMFSPLYNLTRLTFPGAVFIMSAGLAIIPAVLFGWILVDTRRLPRVVPVE